MKSRTGKILIYLPILILLLVFVVLLIRMSGNDPAKEHVYEFEKGIGYHAVVDSIVQDKVGLATSLIYCKNGVVIIPLYYHGLWNKVAAGDSIVKYENGFRYLIYRGPTYESYEEIVVDTTVAR